MDPTTSMPSGSQTSFLYGRQKSPMEIEVIVRKILSYLWREDLLNARSINHLWNSVALPFCQKRTYCKFQYTSKLKAFCTAMEKTNKLPVVNFRMRLRKIKPEACRTFFEKYGSYVQKLEVKDDRNVTWEEDENSSAYTVSMEEYCDNLRFIIQNSPNLEYLSLFYIPTQVYQEILLNTTHLQEIKVPTLRFLHLKTLDDFHPKFLEALFVMFPNLKYLDCIETGSLARTSTESWSSISLKNVKLERLLVRAKMPSQFWELFSNQKLKALKVRCSVLDWLNHEELLVFRKFLVSQQSFLKVMGLDGNTNTHFQPFLFPPMKELSNLEISGRYIQVPLHSIESRLVPHLRRITLDPSWGYESSDSEFTSIVELILINSHNKKDDHPQFPTNIKKFGRIFPRLQKLTCNELELGDSSLAAIFVSFPRLNYLDLSIHTNWILRDVNLVLSGFSAASKPLLDELLRLRSPELFRIDPPYGSIDDLKGLTELTIRFAALYGTVQITEIGVLMGFMRLPRLQQLKLLGKFSISENEAEKLAGCHGNVFILPVEEYIPGCKSLTRMYGKTHGCDEKVRFPIWPYSDSNNPSSPFNCRCDQRETTYSPVDTLETLDVLSLDT